MSSPSLHPHSRPTSRPSSQPTRQPSSSPSHRPNSLPTSEPSLSPESLPTSYPSSGATSVFQKSVDLISITPPSKDFKQVLFFFGFIARGQNSTSDIIVQENSVGQSFVVFGDHSQSSPISLVRGNTTNITPLGQGLSFSTSVRSLDLTGDINRDGREDLIIGSPLDSIVYIIYGTPNFRTKMPIKFKVFGESTSDFFGWSVASNFDLNGDGYDDMIIGALIKNACYIIYGPIGDSISAFNLNPNLGFRMKGKSGSSRTGMSVAPAGDFNHDGFDDVVFSSATSNSANIVYVLFGSTSKRNSFSLDSWSSVNGVRIFGAMFSGTGISLSWLGDMNKDGYDDIAIGCLPNQGGYLAQLTYVIYGTSLVQDLSLISFSSKQGIKMVGGGIVVSGLSDVNNDGYNDLMIINYPDWQGQSGAFMIKYPSFVTRSPTIQPSSYPSEYFDGTITKLPTANVSNSNQTRFQPPSSFPTPSPSSFFFQPTNHPSKTDSTLKPTAKPTFRPSVRPSLKPSYAPSLLPTLKPSKSPKPSMTPAISPSEALTFAPFLKSKSPTHVPTLHPTKFPTSTPSQFPTFSAHSNLDQFMILYITGDKKTVVSNGTTSGVLRKYIIDVDNKTTIGGAGLRNIYQFKPNQNAQVTILNFQPQRDEIDLSDFPSIRSITDLSYSSDPLTLYLPNGQEIILSDMDTFSLTNDNFIFASGGNQSQETASKKKTIWSTNVLAVLILAGGALVLTAAYFQISSRNLVKPEKSRSSKNFVSPPNRKSRNAMILKSMNFPILEKKVLQIIPEEESDSQSDLSLDSINSHSGQSDQRSVDDYVGGWNQEMLNENSFNLDEEAEYHQHIYAQLTSRRRAHQYFHPSDFNLLASIWSSHSGSTQDNESEQSDEENGQRFHSGGESLSINSQESKLEHLDSFHDKMTIDSQSDLSYNIWNEVTSQQSAVSQFNTSYVWYQGPSPDLEDGKTEEQNFIV